MAGIDINTMKNALPDSLKEKGVAKMKNIILAQGQKVKTQLQPKLEQLQSQIPTNGVCLSTTQTNFILQNRNNLVQQLNKIQTVLNASTASIIATSTFLELLITTTIILKNARTATVVASAFSPTIPGAVISTIQTISEVTDKLTFDNLGNSKLNPLNQNIQAAAIPVALTAVSLKNFINLLNTVDIFLTQCSSENLEPVSQDILKTVEAQNLIDNSSITPDSSLYQGFSLEIEEKQYSPEIKQYRAVGKNSQGIIIISTPYSFSTNTPVLIDELKIIIDKDNLKAY
jgi:hypothetical protein